MLMLTHPHTDTHGRARICTQTHTQTHAGTTRTTNHQQSRTNIIYKDTGNFQGVVKEKGWFIAPSLIAATGPQPHKTKDKDENAQTFTHRHTNVHWFIDIILHIHTNMGTHAQFLQACYRSRCCRTSTRYVARVVVRKRRADGEVVQHSLVKSGCSTLRRNGYAT